MNLRKSGHFWAKHRNIPFLIYKSSNLNHFTANTHRLLLIRKKNDMKVLPVIPAFLVVLGVALLTSCGHLRITSVPDHPSPPWFYPNRFEVVRYVCFPEISIYFDLTTRTYIYLDGGVWGRRSVLPPRYRSVDLGRSRYERIRNYNEDNIRHYHEDNNANRGRSNRTSRRTRRSG